MIWVLLGNVDDTYLSKSHFSVYSGSAITPWRR